MGGPGTLSGLNWVDLVIIVLVVVAALRGLRRGATTQVLSYGGLGVGLVVGIALAPLAVGLVATPLAKAVVALTIILALAAIGAGIGSRAGTQGGSLLRRVHLGSFDAAAGMIVAVIITLSVCWIAGTVLANGPSRRLSAGIANSHILRRIDQTLPSTTTVQIGNARRYVNNSGLPQIVNHVNGPKPGRSR